MNLDMILIIRPNPKYIHPYSLKSTYICFYLQRLCVISNVYSFTMHVRVSHSLQMLQYIALALEGGGG